MHFLSPTRSRRCRFGPAVAWFPPPKDETCFSTQIDLADVRRKLGPKYGIHTALRIVGLWRVSLVIKKTKEETSVERGFPQSTIDTLQVLYSGVLVHSET